MPGSTFGTLFRLTTFGESHGPALGGVLDGCPSGIPLDESMIQLELDRRRPGQGKAGTTRAESDRVEILSGVFEGLTTGTPIGLLVRNTSQRSSDYDKLKDVFRPGHADLTFQAKYGLRDHRGGGRSSGRETVARVAGGAVAQELLRTHGITVCACTRELGGIVSPLTDPDGAQDRPYFAADPDVVRAWDERVDAVRRDHDTLGGVVEIMARGVPAGLGEPVFDKLDARLAYALMSVGAVKAVEVGAGLSAARFLGSQNNDPILPGSFASNHAGGILGGISNGDVVVVRAGVKPIPSIARPQQTIDTLGRATEIQVGGRHDICAIPRIVPVLKAMVLLTLADMLLMNRASRSRTD